MRQEKDLYYYTVAVNAPLDKAFTYHSSSPLKPGQITQVPFGRRSVNGIILEETHSVPDFETKEIIPSTEDKPAYTLHANSIRWGQWLSQYYCHPIGQVLNLFIPPLKAKDSKLPAAKLSLEQDYKLSLEQEQVFSKIEQNLEEFKVHLVHGVTGSGKTEIYLQLIKKVLAKGQQALVLVPEISLTPQLEDRFKKRFGENAVATIHSQVTPRSRTNAWYDIAQNKKQILIGARSALFSDFKNLGLIVVDEEHDSSFKQDEKFKYHGRDAAIVLAQTWKCPIVLGSATPSLETWHKAQTNKFQYHQLNQRVFQQNFPDIEIIDLKAAKVFEDQPYWYTKKLHEYLETHLNKNQQVALFLNRRGVAQTIQCMDCGHQIKCPNCDITLTQHGQRDLLCHYCGYFEKLPLRCPECNSSKLSSLGLGTEKVEEVLAKNFPDRTVIRADRDTITNRKQMEAFIEDVESERAQILVGTQMIAKGLDFPKLSFVGILLADVGLNLPDFRANERIFQLVSQVSGRAGRRKDLESHVLIQTYNPDHMVFQRAIAHDYTGFAQDEIEERQIFHYPPFTRLASLRVQSPSPQLTHQACGWVQQKAAALKKSIPEYNGIEILGPTPAPIQKIKNQFRNLFLLKSDSPQSIQNFFRQLTFNTDGLPTKAKISLDIDPLNML